MVTRSADARPAAIERECGADGAGPRGAEARRDRRPRHPDQSINLNPEYRYEENQPPRLTGYTASNQVNVRFRDIRNTGEILDALVAEGANQINGPTLTIDKPEAALDEARAKAIAAGRARAELYARALGMRVVRLLSVSESGGYPVPPPMPMMRAEAARQRRRRPRSIPASSSCRSRWR